MPQCGDVIIAQPPCGKGPRLTIRYVLPRPEAHPREGPPESPGTSSLLGAQPTSTLAVPGSCIPPLEVATSAREFLHRYLEPLGRSFERLITMTPVKPLELAADTPAQCVYVFSENGRALYVGRTKNLRQRMRNHCGSASEHNQAVFAFKLARERTGRLAPGYTKETSRRAMLLDPAFAAEFAAAKERIRRMEVRFVEETDSLGQALLEIYVAVALGTCYNDFDTH